MHRTGHRTWVTLLAAACGAALLLAGVRAEAAGSDRVGLAQQLVEKGRRAFAEGDYDKAIADFEGALQWKPDLAVAHAGLQLARQKKAAAAANPTAQPAAAPTPTPQPKTVTRAESAPDPEPLPGQAEQTRQLAVLEVKARSLAGEEALMRRDFAAAERSYDAVLAALPKLGAHPDVAELRKDARQGLRLAREGLRSGSVQPKPVRRPVAEVTRDAATKPAPRTEAADPPAPVVDARTAAHREPAQGDSTAPVTGFNAQPVPPESRARTLGRDSSGVGRLSEDEEYQRMVKGALGEVGDMLKPTHKILSKTPAGLQQSPWLPPVRRPDSTSQTISRAGFTQDADAEVAKYIQARLLQRVSVSFRKEPFLDAIEQIRSMSDVNILIDPTVVPTLQPVTVSIHNMELRSVLYWMLRFQGLDYRIRRGAIFVSNAAGLADAPVTVVHDVTDLVLAARDFHASESSGGIVLSPVEAQKRLYGLERMGINVDRYDKATRERDEQGHEWARFVTRTIAAGTWTREGDDAVGRVGANTIAYRNGKLVVTHTPEVQDQIRDLLSSFRKARAIQVAILSRFIEVNEDFLQDIGIDWSDGGGGTGFSKSFAKWNVSGNIENQHEVPLSVLGHQLSTGFTSTVTGFLSGWQVQALITAVRKEKRGNVLTAPRVTCFNTQRAFLTVNERRNFVRSYDSDGNPEIGQVNDGIIFEVQPFVSADRRYITLELIPQVNLAGELEEFPFRQSGVNDPLTDNVDNDNDGEIDEADEAAFNTQKIQLPRVTTRQIMTTVSVPDGGTLMIGGLAQAVETEGHATVPLLGDLPLLKYLFRSQRKVDSRNNLIVLVTAHIIQQDED
jgi:tetratricopeptide (TPR) repeat protein